ncbi:hypothetical protein BDQ94DRAFT_146639 [Aspergillus welwitschiae]|uniref:Uncharacterized protein n=1 Tax=Aspergillus welwitschiae TaxID=1341132 RepID=A0A3F3PYD5_9EURO|nr:hypothetical protein BDQ94DRAFT_146639 [Aspergillus welwitschiae]RDH31772.1 hypothetical protein BDQ94DRAFT_146639 [Aspergillus welwitschiae]
MIPIGASSDKYFFLTPFDCFLCYSGLSPRGHCLLYVTFEPYLLPSFCHVGYLVCRIRPSPSVHCSFSFFGSYTCTLSLGNRRYRRFYLPHIFV